MKIWIVLPAYNEAQNIPPIFEGLRELRDDTFNLQVSVILVDDGSTDATVETARAQCGDVPLTVLCNEQNRGLAYTFMRGMLAAAKSAAPRDAIICMDSDNSHIPGQVLHMLRSLQEGRDVVIASRFVPQAVVRGVPLHRRLLSAGMSLLFRAVYPVSGVRDYSCGYRAYRAGLLQEILRTRGDAIFSGDGFSCMVGLLLSLAREDAVFGEIPIVLRYDQKKGSSKMKIGSTVARTLLLLLRERFAR